MVESIDTITMRQYFRIVCSDPFDLSHLGRGTERQRLKAWKRIIEQDSEGGTYTRTVELIEDRQRLSKRALRIQACIVVLSRRPSPSSIDILRSLGITANPQQDNIAMASDRINGLMIKIDDIDRELGERKRPTMAECMRQLSVIKTYVPVSLDTTLAEYRGAQQLVIEMNRKHGKSDN